MDVTTNSPLRALQKKYGKHCIVGFSADVYRCSARFSYTYAPLDPPFAPAGFGFWA
jgi:hypothetical protein